MNESNGNNVSLPLVRRLEAVGFRAWPAASVQYDGSWQVRLTGGHSSKRLNCIVALDPSDGRDIAIRLEKASRKFVSYGRPLVVRETPLTPPAMIGEMRSSGWERFETVIVKTCDLAALDLPETMDHLPNHDIGRFVDASLTLSGEGSSFKPGLAEVLSAIKPPLGLFTIERPQEGPLAAALCVQDNDLAGIMALMVSAARRGEGIGTEILSAALRWARVRGARMAWLQVEENNTAAEALYKKLRFVEAYRYHYWRDASVA
ncbi:GNAT family N-acetyltransferase [Agrobacterium sp. ES01]|uniref:GNAT family N-acetyltransferase n=1 Tax=Agrobacterium sp. ES01 TaxID=3420714 RepID=UPI003D0F7592